MSKFKVNDIVLDDCACMYKILRVGRKYYTCQVLDVDSFKFQVEIKILDNRAVELKKEQL